MSGNDSEFEHSYSKKNLFIKEKILRKITTMADEKNKINNSKMGFLQKKQVDKYITNYMKEFKNGEGQKQQQIPYNGVAGKIPYIGVTGKTKVVEPKYKPVSMLTKSTPTTPEPSVSPGATGIPFLNETESNKNVPISEPNKSVSNTQQDKNATNPEHSKSAPNSKYIQIAPNPIPQQVVPMTFKTTQSSKHPLLFMMDKPKAILSTPEMETLEPNLPKSLAHLQGSIKSSNIIFIPNKNTAVRSNAPIKNKILDYHKAAPHAGSSTCPIEINDDKFSKKLKVLKLVNYSSKPNTAVTTASVTSHNVDNVYNFFTQINIDADEANKSAQLGNVEPVPSVVILPLPPSNITTSTATSKTTVASTTREVKVWSSSENQYAFYKGNPALQKTISTKKHTSNVVKPVATSLIDDDLEDANAAEKTDLTNLNVIKNLQSLIRSKSLTTTLDKTNIEEKPIQPTLSTLKKKAISGKLSITRPLHKKFDTFFENPVSANTKEKLLRYVAGAPKRKIEMAEESDNFFENPLGPNTKEKLLRHMADNLNRKIETPGVSELLSSLNVAVSHSSNVAISHSSNVAVSQCKTSLTMSLLNHPNRPNVKMHPTKTNQISRSNSKSKSPPSTKQYSSKNDFGFRFLRDDIELSEDEMEPKTPDDESNDDSQNLISHPESVDFKNFTQNPAPVHFIPVDRSKLTTDDSVWPSPVFLVPNVNNTSQFVGMPNMVSDESMNNAMATDQSLKSPLYSVSEGRILLSDKSEESSLQNVPKLGTFMSTKPTQDIASLGPIESLLRQSGLECTVSAAKTIVAEQQASNMLTSMAKMHSESLLQCDESLPSEADFDQINTNKMNISAEELSVKQTHGEATSTLQMQSKEYCVRNTFDLSMLTTAQEALKNAILNAHESNMPACIINSANSTDSFSPITTMSDEEEEGELKLIESSVKSISSQSFENLKFESPVKNIPSQSGDNIKFEGGVAKLHNYARPPNSQPLLLSLITNQSIVNNPGLGIQSTPTSAAVSLHSYCNPLTNPPVLPTSPVCIPVASPSVPVNQTTNQALFGSTLQTNLAAPPVSILGTSFSPPPVGINPQIPVQPLATFAGSKITETAPSMIMRQLASPLNIGNVVRSKVIETAPSEFMKKLTSPLMIGQIGTTQGSQSIAMAFVQPSLALQNRTSNIGQQNTAVSLNGTKKVVDLTTMQLKNVTLPCSTLKTVTTHQNVLFMPSNLTLLPNNQVLTNSSAVGTTYLQSTHTSSSLATAVSKTTSNIYNPHAVRVNNPQAVSKTTSNINNPQTVQINNPRAVPIKLVDHPDILPKSPQMVTTDGTTQNPSTGAPLPAWSLLHVNTATPPSAVSVRKLIDMNRRERRENLANTQISSCHTLNKPITSLPGEPKIVKLIDRPSAPSQASIQPSYLQNAQKQLGLEQLKQRGLEQLKQRGFEPLKQRGLEQLKQRGLEQLKQRGFEQLKQSGYRAVGNNTYVQGPTTENKLHKGPQPAINGFRPVGKNTYIKCPTSDSQTNQLPSVVVTHASKPGVTHASKPGGCLTVGKPLSIHESGRVKQIATSVSSMQRVDLSKFIKCTIASSVYLIPKNTFSKVLSSTSSTAAVTSVSSSSKVVFSLLPQNGGMLSTAIIPDRNTATKSPSPTEIVLSGSSDNVKGRKDGNFRVSVQHSNQGLEIPSFDMSIPDHVCRQMDKCTPCRVVVEKYPFTRERIRVKKAMRQILKINCSSKCKEMHFRKLLSNGQDVLTPQSEWAKSKFYSQYKKTPIPIAPKPIEPAQVAKEQQVSQCKIFPTSLNKECEKQQVMQINMGGKKFVFPVPATVTGDALHTLKLKNLNSALSILNLQKTTSAGVPVTTVVSVAPKTVAPKTICRTVYAPLELTTLPYQTARMSTTTTLATSSASVGYTVAKQTSVLSPSDTSKSNVPTSEVLPAVKSEPLTEGYGDEIPAPKTITVKEEPSGLGYSDEIGRSHFEQPSSSSSSVEMRNRKRKNEEVIDHYSEKRLKTMEDDRMDESESISSESDSYPIETDNVKEKQMAFTQSDTTHSEKIKRLKEKMREKMSALARISSNIIKKS